MFITEPILCINPTVGGVELKLPSLLRYNGVAYSSVKFHPSIFTIPDVSYSNMSPDTASYVAIPTADLSRVTSDTAIPPL